MEMTLRRLGIDNIKEVLNGFTLPIGILVLIAMMVLPLPAYLLDTFFVTNILLFFYFDGGFTYAPSTLNFHLSRHCS